MMGFRKAERRKAKLRLGIVGPAGSGKTYSALLIAKGLGGRVAVIDTENGSADLYANVMEYDVCTLEAPYTVQKYLTAIDEAEKAGYETLIIDSLTHAWAGEGGLLDQQGKIADAGRGNSYTAWRQITPLHNRLVEAMLTSKCHVIATMRSKTEYVLEADDKGRQVPKKVGMAPVQREGMDYEFTTVFDLSLTHNATVSKDRTSLFDGQIFKPDEKTGKALLEWLESGADVPEVKPAQQAKPATSLREETAFAATEQKPTVRKMSVNQLNKVREYQAQLDWKDDEVSAFIVERMGKPGGELTREDADALLEIMQEELDKKVA